MKISREWGMPSSDTFTCPPIRSFVMKYLNQSKISVDPFARNFQGCTWTNDLNPNTQAQYHIKALDFLKMLQDKGVHPDLVVFDPPYSMEQAKRSYESYGYKFTYEDSLYVVRWIQEKNLLAYLMPNNSIFLHFGWHSNGMGKKRGFSIAEIMLVAHGSAHNDTLCMAERRTSKQEVFPFNKATTSDQLELAAD